MNNNIPEKNHVVLWLVIIHFERFQRNTFFMKTEAITCGLGSPDKILVFLCDKTSFRRDLGEKIKLEFMKTSFSKN